MKNSEIIDTPKQNKFAKIYNGVIEIKKKNIAISDIKQVEIKSKKYVLHGSLSLLISFFCFSGAKHFIEDEHMKYRLWYFLIMGALGLILFVLAFKSLIGHYVFIISGHDGEKATFKIKGNLNEAKEIETELNQLINEK